MMDNSNPNPRDMPDMVPVEMTDVEWLTVEIRFALAERAELASVASVVNLVAYRALLRWWQADLSAIPEVRQLLELSETPEWQELLAQANEACQPERWLKVAKQSLRLLGADNEEGSVAAEEVEETSGMLADEYFYNELILAELRHRGTREEKKEGWQEECSRLVGERKELQDCMVLPTSLEDNLLPTNKPWPQAEKITEFRDYICLIRIRSWLRSYRAGTLYDPPPR